MLHFRFQHKDATNMLDKLEDECNVHREAAWNKDRALEVIPLHASWFSHCLMFNIWSLFRLLTTIGCLKFKNFDFKFFRN